MINIAPQVYAGKDQSILFPRDYKKSFQTHLKSEVTDDGLPNGKLSLKWRKVGGPGDVKFANFKKAQTKATFSKVGDYVLSVIANDGDKSAEDEIVVTIKKEVENLYKPVVWWKFDEGSGEKTTESITGYNQEIESDKALWGAGISGTGLIFNGWSSVVSLPGEKVPLRRLLCIKNGTKTFV